MHEGRGGYFLGGSGVGSAGDCEGAGVVEVNMRAVGEVKGRRWCVGTLLIRRSHYMLWFERSGVIDDWYGYALVG